MTELKRWLDDEDAPDHLRGLLGAGRRSLPLPGAVHARSARKVAALAALPVGFLALLTSSGTVLAAAAGMSLGIAASIGGPIVFRTEAPPEASAPSSAPSASPTARSPARHETNAPPPAAPSAVKPKASASASRSVADSLGEETELLERSRQLIGSNPNGALALVEEHARRFPRGKLAIERQLIEVDALQRAGRRAEARA